MKLTINQLGTSKQIQTKFGLKEKNYVKAEEYGDKFLNFWINDYTKNWKVGQEVDVDSVEERAYTAQDGTQKTSYDIKLANKESGIIKLLEEIRSTQIIQGVTLQSIVQKLSDKKEDSDYPEMDEPPAF